VKKIELFANGAKRRLHYKKGLASKILSNQKMAGLSCFSTGLPERGMDTGNGHTHMARACIPQGSPEKKDPVPGGILLTH
jgi:hypothetical protein